MQIDTDYFTNNNLNKYDYELIFQQLLKENYFVAGGNEMPNKTINLQKFTKGLYIIMDKLHGEKWRANDLVEAVELLYNYLCNY